MTMFVHCVQLLGPDHPDVAKQFCNLAILCSHLGRYDEVEHYYQRALEIFQVELEQDNPNITKTMNNLVSVFDMIGRLVQVRCILYVHCVIQFMYAEKSQMPCNL